MSGQVSCGSAGEYQADEREGVANIRVCSYLKKGGLLEVQSVPEVKTFRGLGRPHHNLLVERGSVLVNLGLRFLQVS